MSGLGMFLQRFSENHRKGNGERNGDWGHEGWKL